MNILRTVLILLTSFLALQLGVAQNTNPWTFETSFRQKEASKEKQFKKARSLSLNKEALEKILATAPLRFSKEASEQKVILSLPSPNGDFNEFRIVEAPVLHPDLGKKFPSIKSYAGQGISDPTAYLRFAWSPHGFHAVILSGTQETIIIDTQDKENRINHYTYYKKDRIKTDQFPFTCTVQHTQKKKEPLTDLFAEQRSAGDCQLRTYRLALACTGEYARFHGGTTADALAAMNTTMTRVNGVFETDLAVTMEIIPNNTSIIYLSSTTDPYSNNNGGRMIDQNQETIDNIIGSANYDIGHVFSTGGGGLAGLGVVCDFADKAAGVTGFTEPVGDQFDLDFVAHELGHQFGAEHTFTGDEESCAGNIAVNSAVEPGSGSTIMGYAQLCGSQDVQQFSDAYFHARSILEISNFILSAGNSCAQLTDLNNEPPTVEAGANYRIPQSTPFVLTGTASDPDNNTLSYTWEQMDRSTNQPQPPLSSNRSGPLFRSFSPSSSAQRFFPRLVDLVANRNSIWEVLPASNRNLAFRFTVRDNNLGGGCTEEDDVSLTVIADAGPFLVSHPNVSTVSWAGSTKELVSWEVANTDVAPISATEVDIYLSTDGGFTYPELLIAGVPNTGSAEITVPNLPTTQARIMVKGADNIFFDISNRDFIIKEVTNDFVTSVTPTNQVFCTEANAFFNIDIGVSGSFDGPVVLSTVGLPDFFTANFSNNNFIPPNSSRLTIETNSAVAEAEYPFTLNISGTTGVQTRELSIVVFDGVSNIIEISEPLNNANGVTTTPIFKWASVIGADEYILQVATSPSFSSLLLEETITDTAFVLPTALELTTRYYWKVVPKGACFGNDIATTYSFITAALSCEIYEPSDLPQNISRFGMPEVNSVINVPTSGIITDVNILNLDIDHSFVGDLSIELTSPEQSVNRIIDAGLCDFFPNLKINFDDEAQNRYANIPCPPTDGRTYVPFDSLNIFKGEQMEGAWTLLVQDIAEDDGGSFENWALEVCFLGESKLIPLAISLEKTDVTCSNAQDGRISVNAIDGLGTYSYAWNNGATTATIENLSPAIYTVTVNDGNTSIEESVTINPATPIDLNITENTPSCFGLSDGSIEIRSNEALRYVWNTGATTTRLDGLSAGTYTLEVTNAQNCKESRTFVLTEPGKIINTLTPKQITCAGGMDGAVTLSLFDNNNPSFQWSNAATTQSIDNVSVGTYSVTVTAANNCQETMDVVLTEPAPIRVVAVATTPSCRGGTDGQLSAEASDGVTPYNYSWNTGATTAIVPAVSAGTYQVTVTDANDCSNSAELIVSESTKFININLEAISASCSGASDGQITAEIVDGLAPFTYIWNDGSDISIVDSINGGLYRVTVTDANSCSNIAEIQVEEPKPINIDFTIINASCFGSSDGQIVADITGGTGEYTYLWDNGMTIKSLLEAPAGNYSLTVTDANNCQAISEMIVAQSADIAINITSVMLSCNGASDGQIITEVEEANGPYTYLWSNGSTAESIGNLPAGMYSLTITSANGCEKMEFVELREPNPLVLTSTITPISCNGLSDGQIAVDIVDGEGTYTYTWDNPDLFNQNRLGSGTYGLTVTDESGCTTSEVFILEEPLLINARFSSISISEVDGMDGEIVTTVEGGTGAYTFEWDTGDSTANLTNVGTGTYILTVTDANACSRAFAAIVQGVECFNFALDFSIVNAQCVDMPNGRITALTNGGNEPYTYLWSTGDTTMQITNLISGEYTLTITDALGCTLTDMREVKATSNIQLSLASKTDYSCQNQTTGSARVEATEGSGNYTYSWPNGATSAEVFNLEPGNYTVTVQDEIACAAALEVVILSTDVVRPPVFKETTTAFLDATGMVTLTPENLLALAIDSCSIQQLEFSELQFDCDDIGENTITVETTFIGDSTVMRQLNIEVVDTIKPIIQCPVDIVVSACTDTIHYELEGGLDNCGPIFYMFPAGTESGSVFPEDTTTITYTLNDKSDNLVTCTFRLIKEMELSVEVNPEVLLTYEIDEEGVYVITSIIDCMQPDLSDLFLVQGGSEPYEVAVELLAGTLMFNRYVIRMSDANGCLIEQTVVVPIPTEDGNFVVNSEITPVSFGAKDGSIELEVVDGVSLDYKWFRGDSLLSKEKDIFDLSAGTYTLVIEDMFGCLMVDSFMIDMVVSANHVYLDHKIDLFPNPTTGAVTIEFALEKQQMVAVDLYDVNGRLVRPTLNYSAKNDRIQIDLNTFAKGVYLAKIKVDEGVVVKKIVLH